MTIKSFGTLLLVYVLAGTAVGEYPCVCCYVASTHVYVSPDVTSHTLGDITMFDCKALHTYQSATPAYFAVQYAGHVGFVINNDSIAHQQLCLKDPLSSDLVTSTVSPSPITSSSPVVSTNVIQGCPVGWYHFESSCYLFRLTGNEVANWKEANDNCNALNSHQVFIESKEEQEFLRVHLQPMLHGSMNRVWTGGSDSGDEGHWTWLDPHNGHSDLQYTAWRQYQPDNHDRGENCIELRPDHDFRWNDNSCDDERGYICEMPSGPFMTPPLVICPSDWIIIQSDIAIYLISASGDDLSTWEEAKTKCESCGTTLAVIQSSHEQSFIEKSFEHINGDGHRHYWIGASDKENEGTFVWKTTSGQSKPLLNNTYTNWSGGEPNAASAEEDCVSMIETRHFEWVDDQCDAHMHFICQSNLVPSLIIGK